jgi:dTDP-4-amino-4,6-dideoxygalactose transaminase
MKSVQPAAIPVLRPLLPAAAKIMPYWKRIDSTRTYSNFGPLCVELQQRLEELFETGSNSVFCTSSGTSALLAAILASAGPATARRPLAAIPGFTFPATAAAAERCGYTPYLIDIDKNTWELVPDELTKHPRIEEFGIVVPVAPFGKPVPQEPWLRFRRKTQIPVVIDAAASFPFVSTKPKEYLGKIPVALSFHATKSFAVGEGGCVIWSNPDAEKRVTRAINFGFFNSRQCMSASFNGKMSEYHAAIGLAELDAWPNKLIKLRRAIQLYQKAEQDFRLDGRLFIYPKTDFNYPLFFSTSLNESRRLQKVLARERIGFRLWYGGGIREHPYFRNAPGDQLTICKNLGSRLLGLPMAIDLNWQEVCKIIGTIQKSISE